MWRSSLFALVLLCVTGLAQNPRDARAAIQLEVARAAAARDKGQSGLVNQHLQRGARIVGKDLSLAGAMASMTLSARLYPETERICASVLRKRPGDPLVNAVLGATLLQLKRYREALGHLERALVVHPDHAGWLSLKARALLYLDRAKDARGLLDRALKLQPKDRMVLEIDAEWYFRTLHAQGCEAASRRLLAVHPSSLRGHTLLIRSLRMQNRTADALTAAAAAEKAVGPHGEILLERGVARLGAGQLKGAIHDLEGAARKLKSSALPWQHLAKAYARLGDRKKARAARKRWKALSRDH